MDGMSKKKKDDSNLLFAYTNFFILFCSIHVLLTKNTAAVLEAVFDLFRPCTT